MTADTTTALVVIAAGVSVLAALVAASRYTRSVDNEDDGEDWQARALAAEDAHERLFHTLLQRTAEFTAELTALHEHCADITDRVEAYERQAQPVVADTRPGAAGMAQHPAWTATRDEIDQETANKRRWDGVGD